MARRIADHPQGEIGNESPWNTPETVPPGRSSRSGCPLAPLPKERHLRRISSGSTRATIILWLALVGAMVVLYQEESFRTLTPWIPLVFVGPIAAVMILRVRKTRALNQANNAALEHLNAGRLDQAAKAFDQLAAAAGSNVLHKLVAVYNLAFTELRRGDFERALSLFSLLETKAKSQYRGSYVRASAALQSMAHALSGELEAASCWLREADRREGDANSEGFLVLAAAILECRRGRAREAERLLDEKWQTAISTLSGNLLGALRLVRALAMTQIQSDSEEIRDMIAGAKPFRPWDYRYLTAGWPEMQAFIEPHARH